MSKIAIFSRNHRDYLERACEIAAIEPSQLIVFRSERRWVTAKKELNKSKILTIYLAPTESDGTIQYEATVKTIKLDPTEDDPETRLLLANVLPGTKNEKFWGKVLQDESSVESQPEELQGPNGYFEGALHQVTVNAYERNRAARKACIEKHGSDCSVCGFSFGTVFGHIGLDYIHIHHLRPLATIRAGYVVDPIEDLRPVCANCHSMLHRRTPPYSINELRSLIALKAVSH